MDNKKIIKVFFLIPNFYQGGGQKIISDLSFNLPLSIKSTLVLFENKTAFPFRGNLISLNVSLSTNFLQRACALFIRFYKFRKLVKKEKPDWVVSFGNSGNVINAFSNKNSIVRADMFLSKEYGGIFRRLFRIIIGVCFNRALKVIAVSKASARDLTDNFGVKKEKISVIYNPINVEEIKNLAKETIEPEYEEIFKNPVIITSGRLVRQKGQWHLIRAFSRAKKEIQNLKMIILGEGELESYCKELINGYGLEKDIFLLGWQKNPFKFIARSKLFILPSLWEGLPMVLIEATACGVPIISTDCQSGPREILAPDTDYNFQTEKMERAGYGALSPVPDGKFYAAADPLTIEENTLAMAINDSLKDEDFLRDFSRKSLKRAQDFDIKNIIKEWDFLYDI